VNEWEHKLIAAICARAAECWAEGSVRLAERWFGAAVEEVGDNEYTDNEDAAR
jgi:hypothetical protein